MELLELDVDDFESGGRGPSKGAGRAIRTGERLLLTIISAIALTGARKLDAFCVVSYRGKRIGRTRVAKNTVDPVWGHQVEFVAAGGAEDPADVVIVKLYHQGWLFWREFLGEVVISISDWRKEGKTEKAFRLVGKSKSKRALLNLSLEVVERAPPPALSSRTPRAVPSPFRDSVASATSRSGCSGSSRLPTPSSPSDSLGLGLPRSLPSDPTPLPSAASWSPPSGSGLPRPPGPLPTAMSAPVPAFGLARPPQPAPAPAPAASSPPSPPQQWDCFVSYAHKDREAVFAYVELLEAAGLSVWIDRELKAGQRWMATIAESMARCRAFVCFLSEAFVGSKNCDDEMQFAHHHLRAPKFPVWLSPPGDIALPVDYKMMLASVNWTQQRGAGRRALEAACRQLVDGLRAAGLGSPAPPPPRI